MYDLAEKENIYIKEVSLPEGYLGLYRAEADIKLILISTCIDGEKTKRCVLAEELGHHFTSVGNVMKFCRQKYQYLGMKQEKRAWKWALDFLVPTDKLLECVNDKYTIPEIGDIFGVTIKFVAMKMYTVKREGENNGQAFTCNCFCINNIDLISRL
jgi:Zn-dependent peptidase ImmA (M78 family)